jgi:HD-GYP domain-containing protein (c-di-GMP phosphodiesterase class II)
MSDLILNYPVKTLNDSLLLPEGVQLSSEVLSDLISKAGTASYKQYSLIEHGSIKKDTLNFLSVPPYNNIFSGKTVFDDLLSYIGEINLISPLIESLDYFRQNDMYTYRHILNVFILCVHVVKEMKPSNLTRIKEAASGPIHDIGKICVPMHILKKAAPLTIEERRIVEHHSTAGYALLSYYLRQPENTFSIVARDHHERGDGSGYPRGIKLKDHIVEVIAVCDVYDALISSRPYRSAAYDNRTAIEELIEMGERNILNRDVIKALVSINRKSKTHYSACKVSKEKRGEPPSSNNYGIFEDDS